MKLLLTYTLICIHVSFIQFAYVIAPIGDLLYTTHTTYVEMCSPQDRLLFSRCLGHYTCLLLALPSLPRQCPALKPRANIPRVSYPCYSHPWFIFTHSVENIPNLKSEYKTDYTFSRQLGTCIFGPKISTDSALEDGVMKIAKKDI